MAQRTAKAKRSAGKQNATAKTGGRKVASRHNYLPFFRKEKGGDPSWWNVKPKEIWPADLETGREYARIFSPNLRNNAGGPMLGWIVDGMVKAAKSRKGRNRLEIHKPAKGRDCWHGAAVCGMEQYEWFYWTDGEVLRVNKFVVQPDQRICDGHWMERAPIPDELRRDVALAVLLTQEGLA